MEKSLPEPEPLDGKILQAPKYPKGAEDIEMDGYYPRGSFTDTVGHMRLMRGVVEEVLGVDISEE